MLTGSSSIKVAILAISLPLKVKETTMEREK
jgi:hypothetical protein